jgi:putative transposase
MPQSLARVLVHLIFSTKNRAPLITPDRAERTFAYLAGTLNAIDCPVVAVGGAADHVHLLFVLGRTIALSKAVEELKKESSKWAKEHVNPAFYWQNGYAAFSVSPSNVDKVKAYIADQAKHHEVMSFQDE